MDNPGQPLKPTPQQSMPQNVVAPSDIPILPTQDNESHLHNQNVAQINLGQQNHLLQAPLVNQPLIPGQTYDQGPPRQYPQMQPGYQGQQPPGSQPSGYQAQQLQPNPGYPQMQQPQMPVYQQEQKPYEVPKTATNQNISSNQSKGYEGAQSCCGECQACCANYICCCCCTSTYQKVPEGFSGIIMRFGKFYKLIGPGLHYLNPDIDTLTLIDKRERVLEMARQIVVTNDNISVGIDSVTYFKVIDSYKSQFASQRFENLLVDLISTALRQTFGRFTLQEMLSHREEHAAEISKFVEGPASQWGIKVIRTLLQDIALPQGISMQMQSGAVAKKKAEGIVIKAQADVQSAKLQRDAAQILSSDAAMQIRFLESLELMAKSGNPKMVFFPSDYSQIGMVNDHLVDEGTKLIGNQWNQQ